MKNSSPPQQATISVSIGLAHYPSDGKCFDDLLKIADKSLYQLISQKKLRDTV
ncbi:diguanylate cyclase domain-containing protein [Neobacillus drentensis]|uniref:diguanylate cyclase domain-containing protein n=1 Tax=Neobacillus drentensis TaxID=220684 RepID=UPI003B5890A4